VDQMKTVINPKSVVLVVVVGSMHSVSVSNNLKEIEKTEPTVALSAGKLRYCKYVMTIIFWPHIQLQSHDLN